MLVTLVCAMHALTRHTYSLVNDDTQSKRYTAATRNLFMGNYRNFNYCLSCFFLFRMVPLSAIACPLLIQMAKFLNDNSLDVIP